MTFNQAYVVFNDYLATDLLEVTRDPKDLSSGWWAVVQTFEGEFFGFKFKRPELAQISKEQQQNVGSYRLKPSEWTSNISQSQYESGVGEIREAIARGWVYQTNYCRILSQEIESDFDFLRLYQNLSQRNPAPYGALLVLPKSETGLAVDLNIVSASPELFIQQDGELLMSSPIKGTAKTPDGMLEKDAAENIMIVDLIRNDLSQVTIPGTVTVPELLRIENHPGLSHLVSDVVGRVKPNVSWNEILRAMCPPGSVSGAPKSSSLQLISELEPEAREIYCGTIGWIDVDENQARLSVAIRTFWQSLTSTTPKLCFGTGAGITYGSDPTGEWLETELKAQHLLSVASASH